ncbi:unnamed protein product [Natator depressus]
MWPNISSSEDGRDCRLHLALLTAFQPCSFPGYPLNARLRLQTQTTDGLAMQYPLYPSSPKGTVPSTSLLLFANKKKKKKRRRQSVGQINLSRENRSVSKSVNCAELERKKFYFFRMKAKQDPSLFTLSHPFLKKNSEHRMNP